MLLTKAANNIDNSRCFVPGKAFRSTPGAMGCRCGSMPWNYAARGNGEPAGWRVISTCNWSSIGWTERLPDSREGTSWRHILQTLVCYRLIDPGSEWRLHRQWFEQSAVGDLLGEDYSLVSKNGLYRCLDKVLPHKAALLSHLQQRWQDLFGASFEVLLYDLTSTYFELDPPDDENDKRRYGYSRDKRCDCVQVVIALIVTPEGFPLAYQVLPGNDNTTLRGFLQKIENQYGKAQRIWVMDRGMHKHRNCSRTRPSARTRKSPPTKRYDLRGNKPPDRSPDARLSFVNGASNTVPLPTASRKPAYACSPSPACLPNNGRARAPPTRSSGCTRSSSDG
jgi:hypothetical protein